MHNILDHGAKAGGTTLCTAAIQKAIDAAAASGGGTVRFPPGTFLSGALRMRSRVALELDKGATLLGSPDLQDYYGPPTDPDGREVEGKAVFRNLIHGEGLHDVALRGKGTIDGSGAAFRDKTKPRTKCIYLANCRNVVVEGLHLRNAGCWMQHYRLCEKLTLRSLTVFNHAAFNNDGMNIDSCRDVAVTGCRVDSDDDGIVLKSLSDQPCRDVRITNCTVSSHCNALKMGTESGGGFVDIAVANCTVLSPKESQKIYGRQRGLAAIALEIVDGGRLENVTVSGIDIEGVSVAIFLRLGNRARPYVKADAKPGVGTFRNVRLSNIVARGTSEIGCSITGLPGHPIEDVALTNVRLGFEGGGARERAAQPVPEREASYPESTMFGTLPAYGFYCRHVRGLTFTNVRLGADKPDLRHAIVLDDAHNVVLDRLDAQWWAGGASMLRLAQARGVAIRALSPKAEVETLLHLEGGKTERIALEKCDLREVRTVATFAADASPAALHVGE